MAVVKNLMVRVGADFSGLSGASKKMRTSMQQMQNSVQTSTRAMSRSVNGLNAAFRSLARIVSVAAIIKFGKDSLQAASDLQEVQNVVDVAFGKMAYKINDFAKTSVESFGMSEFAAKKSAGMYAAMGKSMGLSLGNATDMAVTLTALSGDMASFYNTSQSVADTALQSVFTGETETLKKYGVVMTEANLKAYALSKGIKEAYTKMSQAEKVQLRYAYVTEQLSMASGDFARTSNSWANQTRVLAERFNQLKTAIGQGLIQALTPALNLLNRLMEKLVDFGKKFAEVTAIVFGKQTAVASESATATETAADAQEDLADATKDASKEAKKALASFDDLNVLQGKLAETAEEAADNTDTSTNTGGTTTEENPTETSSVLEQALQRIKDALQPVIDALSRLKSALQPLKDFVAQGLKDFYEKFMVPVGKWILGEGLPRLLDVLTGIAQKIDWTKINEALARLWDAISKFAITVGEGLVRFFELVGETIQQIDWAKIINALTGVWEALTPFAETIGDGLLWFYENVISPLIVWAANALIPAALDLLSAAIEALDAIIDAAKPLFEWIWEEFLQPIGEWAGKVIIDAIKFLTDAFKKFSDWARNNKSVITNMAGAILGMLAGIWIYNTAKKIITFIGDLVYVFGIFARAIATTGAASLIANAGLVLLAGAIAVIALNWSKMNGLERVTAVLGALSIAAAVAAAAVGALQSAWTLGLAAAAIVVGIVAITSAIKSANSDAQGAVTSGLAGAGKNISATVGDYSVPKLASGAVIDPNDEFVAILGDQKQGKNIEAPLETIQEALRSVMNERAGDIVLEIDGQRFARLTNPYNVAESNRRGVKIIDGLSR